MKNGYIFTRKLKNTNNDIDDGYTLFKIDADTQTEKELFYNDVILEYASYMYNNIVYIRGRDGIYKVNLESKNKDKENLDFGTTFYIAGNAYSLIWDNSDVAGIKITSLKNGENISIKK